MLTPWLIRFIWYVGLLSFLPLIVLSFTPIGLALLPFGGGALAVIVGILQLRLVCELLVVIFNIFDGSKKLTAKIRHLSAGQQTQRGAARGPLLFHGLFLPLLVRACWVLGTLALFAAPGLALSQAEGELDAKTVIELVLPWLPAAIVAVVAWRVVCELLIVMIQWLLETRETVSALPGSPSQAKSPNSQNVVLDLVAFRAVIAPIILQIVWVIAIVVFGYFAFYYGKQFSQSQGEALGRFADLVIETLIAIGCLLAARVILEYVMAIFCVQRNLQTVDREIEGIGPTSRTSFNVAMS